MKKTLKRLEDINHELNECIFDIICEQYSDKTIKDVDDFILKLKAENLYSKEIEEFIENYLSYYN